MIACSCHAVSDRVLREAAATGLSHDEIVASTHAGTDCGHCRETVAEIVTESHRPCRGAHACPGCPRRGAA
jgi:bacterioferritin-associated ferredoxin